MPEKCKLSVSHRKVAGHVPETLPDLGHISPNNCRNTLAKTLSNNVAPGVELRRDCGHLCPMLARCLGKSVDKTRCQKMYTRRLYTASTDVGRMGLICALCRVPSNVLTGRNVSRRHPEAKQIESDLFPRKTSPPRQTWGFKPWNRTPPAWRGEADYVMLLQRLLDPGVVTLDRLRPMHGPEVLHTAQKVVPQPNGCMRVKGHIQRVNPTCIALHDRCSDGNCPHARAQAHMCTQPIAYIAEHMLGERSRGLCDCSQAYRKHVDGATLLLAPQD